MRAFASSVSKPGSFVQRRMVRSFRVFPREGDPTLIALEPQADDAQRTAWTDDIRLFAGYD